MHRPRFKFTPPHPFLTLIALILGIIGIRYFTPAQYNFHNWTLWAWTGFWWLWFLPFFGAKVYDWMRVKRTRGTGTASPMWRLLGVMIVATLIVILIIIVIINIVAFFFG